MLVEPLKKTYGVSRTSNTTLRLLKSSQDKHTSSQLLISHPVKLLKTVSSHPRVLSGSALFLTISPGPAWSLWQQHSPSAVIESGKALCRVCPISPPQQEKLCDHTDPLWFLCGRDHVSHTLENITHQAAFMLHVCACVWGDLEHPQQ